VRNFPKRQHAGNKKYQLYRVGAKPNSKKGITVHKPADATTIVDNAVFNTRTDEAGIKTMEAPVSRSSTTNDSPAYPQRGRAEKPRNDLGQRRSIVAAQKRSATMKKLALCALACSAAASFAQVAARENRRPKQDGYVACNAEKERSRCGGLARLQSLLE
jgi:hypothetical protein